MNSFILARRIKIMRRAAGKSARPRRKKRCGKCRSVKKASQSLRPQAQIEYESFFPTACTSEKILIGSQTCELCAIGAQRVRCSEPQLFQTRAQRSGSRLRAWQKFFLTRSAQRYWIFIPLTTRGLICKMARSPILTSCSVTSTAVCSIPMWPSTRHFFPLMLT